MSRRHQVQEPDLLAELERRARFRDHYIWINESNRIAGPPITRRQWRTVVLCLLGVFAVGVTLSLGYVLGGSRPPEVPLFIALIALVAAVVLGGLEYAARATLRGEHHRRWPGD